MKLSILFFKWQERPYLLKREDGEHEQHAIHQRGIWDNKTAIWNSGGRVCSRRNSRGLKNER